MTDDVAFKWVFPAYFRSHAFGWRGSRLACQRIKEAISEIKKVHRQDLILAAEGAVVFLEKVSPALEQVDSSSGSLGNAVHNAIGMLVPVIAVANVSRKVRERWLDRLWSAIETDGIGYLDGMDDRWGELCGTAEVASAWADRMVDTVRFHWADRQNRGYYKGTTVCLSCLLTAKRHDELLALLESAPFHWWGYHQYGFHALVAMGKREEAMAYAQALTDSNDQQSIDQACEQLLLEQGLHELAYERYGLRANRSNTGINTFRAIAKKYPMKNPSGILADLIASTPASEGKWFATARQLGFLDLALELANRSHCDPLTLNRAAQDALAEHPDFAQGVAMAALRWLCEGYGYEITSSDVRNSYRIAVEAAERTGGKEQVAAQIADLLAKDRSVGKFVQKSLGVFQRR